MTSPIRTLARGDGSGIVQRRRTVVRDAAEWQALWAAHAGPAAALPSVDFSTHRVAAAFAGERPSAGFSVEITAVRREGAGLAVAVDERSPGPGMLAAQIIVTPFHIVALPRYDGEVTFVDAAAQVFRPRPAPAPAGPNTTAVHREPRTGSAASAQAASSTGLDPNLAAALAYLAGPFSGLLILLVERANGYVRFHAWQSIVGLGGLGLLSAGLLVLSFVTLLLSPILFTVMYWSSGVVAIAWLALWAVCLVKAFTGVRWEMPVAGRHAQRLATRQA